MSVSKLNNYYKKSISVYHLTELAWIRMDLYELK